MDQLTQFITHHWLLVVALVAVAALLVFEETKKNVGGVNKIPASKAVDLINHHHAVVVDLRTADDFRNSHITDAINIPQAELERSINKLNKYKSKPIILVCRIGPESLKAGIMLRKQGFTQIYL